MKKQEKKSNQNSNNHDKHSEYFQDLADSMQRFLAEDISDTSKSVHIPSLESVIQIIHQALKF